MRTRAITIKLTRSSHPSSSSAARIATFASASRTYHTTSSPTPLRYHLADSNARSVHDLRPLKLHILHLSRKKTPLTSVPRARDARHGFYDATRSCKGRCQRYVSASCMLALAMSDATAQSVLEHSSGHHLYYNAHAFEEVLYCSRAAIVTQNRNTSESSTMQNRQLPLSWW